MLGKGSGFHIPVYRLIREYKSYRDCRAGENLEWEEENVLWLNRRYVPAKAVGAALLMLLLTGVSFSAEYKNENIEIASYGDLMALTALSFICAQDSYNLTAAPPSLLYRRIKESADTFQNFTFSEAGITVEAAFQCCGYEFRQAQYSSSEVLVPVYGEEPYFQVEYRVYKSGDEIEKTIISSGANVRQSLWEQLK